MTLRKNQNDGPRHGSVGADSMRSTDTVKGPFEGIATMKVHLPKMHTKRQPLERSSSRISPGANVASASSVQTSIAPWHDGSSSKEDVIGQQSKSKAMEKDIPTINRHSPAIQLQSQFPFDESYHSSSPAHNNGLYGDFGDNFDQVSPGYAPPNGTNLSFIPDHRRPSIASATTVSSSNSKQSVGGRVQRKLQGFFGEDVSNAMNDTSRHNSEASFVQVAPPSGSGTRNRNNSSNDPFARNGPPSPGGSRPRSPGAGPSSEVTPWVFQDAENAPSPTTAQGQPESSGWRTARTNTAARLHLPGHRYNRSNEDKGSGTPSNSARPTTSREPSFIGRREMTAPSSAMSSTLNVSLPTRSTSPAPSATSSMGHNTPRRSPSTVSAPKRSLLDRFTGRHKHDRAPHEPDPLPQSASTSPLMLPSTQQQPIRTRHDSKFVAARPPKGRGTAPNGASVTRRESKLPFKNRRADTATEVPRPVRDPNATVHEEDADALWRLDTDMSKMEGIVDKKQPPMTPPASEIYTGWPGDQPTNTTGTDTVAATQQGDDPGWDAPDSWAVAKVVDDNMHRLEELDEEGNVPTDEDPGPMYFMRIFRADSTFAVISAGLSTSAADLITIMAKKTFLQDELDKYQIILRKQDTSRQLNPNERPLQMQKRLLEMAGYRENDHLEDLGGADHGYLCRFTFLPSKLGGYSGLERDPGLNKNGRFNHVDLSAKNLVTIPIALYQRAGDIITLNLSKNLSLDIPKDFIQSCTQLREIKYTGNEAWRVPPSLALANKLTNLDISNNKFEQLEHADLEKLQSLLSLKLANNKLSNIPAYFGRYRALRSLNLSSNLLTEVPDAIKEIATLVDLDVSFNSISSLGNMGALTRLERLWATNNNLSGPFDESFSSLVSLREIDARFNTITNIDVVSQLPSLEVLMLGHNSISSFEGSFYALKMLFLNHNPVTKFDLSTSVPSLAILNLASAKLSQLPDALFMKMSGLTKLTLNKNHFVQLSANFGLLSKLEYLTVAKNDLGKLPAEIGRLTELRYLDVRENNLGKLPPEIWYARRLETLNVSSNVLTEFPKPGAPLPPLPDTTITPLSMSSSFEPAVGDEESLGRLEDFQLRRPSQASGMVSNISTSPSTGSRKASIVSFGSAKSSNIGRASIASSAGTITPGSRKDSTLSGRLSATFAGSLRHLFLADNRLEDDVHVDLSLLNELRILNLSYNDIYDFPHKALLKWPNLTELYLSGNYLTSIPGESITAGSSLKVLHINNNRIQTLPDELGNVQKLAIMDVGNNLLKYNVTNDIDWNWNSNRQLRYLNLSGNKRFEIKPGLHSGGDHNQKLSTDFSSLLSLRILGLMDVTLTIPSVPDQNPDRRVRLAGSMIGNTMPFGMADTLGRNEHLSTLDMVVPKLRGHEDEALIGLFDGQTLSQSGSRIAKFLVDQFKHAFIQELEKIQPGENAGDALRRTYLGLNKELAAKATQALDAEEHPSSAIVHRGSISGPALDEHELSSGSTAAVMYLHAQELWMSNVGDAQALIIQSEGGHRMITKKHDPAEASERERIREAGGYVSRQGKLNDQLDVSRAFGFVKLTPCVIAAPHITKIDLNDSHEMVLLASRELWDYLTPEFAVDVARQLRGDLMGAAQKLRDLAIAFGATGKIMVMIVGVSEARKRERGKLPHGGGSMSMGPSGAPDDYFGTTRKAKRYRETVEDSKLARLDNEVDAPEGDVALVFTDIKNSTVLWEICPIAMQSAIKMHNEVMRRQLRIIGGYEVKTEGDAFMVAFPTVTSALLWSFTVQSQLLEVHWPSEILSSIHGQEIQDGDGNVIFRGLSVRMGIHWGRPVCERDVVTKRMDYFGPMVNRASRIESVADGGQICVSSDFIQEIHKLLETHIESDRSGSTGSDDTYSDDVTTAAIRRELRSLSSQGFEVKDLGQRTLKGLENPEYVYLMYPHSLASRLVVQQQKAEAEARAQASSNAAGAAAGGTAGAAFGKKVRNSQLTIDTDTVWDLWNMSLRLEMLCSTLEYPGVQSLKPPETALLERLKHGGGELTDRFLLNFVEHQISRIETCVSTLAIRNMIRPFKDGMLRQACPMDDILSELTGKLAELKQLKAGDDAT